MPPPLASPAFLPPAHLPLQTFGDSRGFTPLPSPFNNDLLITKCSASPKEPPSRSPQPPTSPSQRRIIETFRAPPWSRAFQTRRMYVHDPAKRHCDVTQVPASLISSPSPRGPFWRDLLSLTILPSNFPASVAPGYLQWVRWHIARQTFRNAYYVLGTTSLLKALGLGTGKAVVVGATLKWVLKDGLGMASKLAVSARLAGLVDRDPKMWRMIGDSFMAMATAIEISSLLKPSYFLLFGALSGLLKEAAGAMSGPSYRVFLDAFAVTQNIGDVSSRGEAQVVLGNLIGLAIGVVVSGTIERFGGGLAASYACFAVLATLHLGSTFNAVGTVRLRSLNWKRLDIIIDEFLKTGVVIPVENANGREKLFSWPDEDRLILGASLFDFAKSVEEMEVALRDSTDTFVVVFKKGKVGLVLREDIEVLDVIRAILQGRKFLEMVSTRELTTKEVSDIRKESYRWVQGAFPRFKEGLEEMGWSTSKLLTSMGPCTFREVEESTKNPSY
eukprot:GFKZ01011146.1.p1 GENE.GFKZ01011146.1~~GFKZ01011146.1.p1  ORF type:complete len:536 (+),score=61.09 GFKZ01011146.1:107-1609(+)